MGAFYVPTKLILFYQTSKVFLLNLMSAEPLNNMVEVMQSKPFGSANPVKCSMGLRSREFDGQCNKMKSSSN